MAENNEKYKVMGFVYAMIAGALIVVIWGWYCLEQFTDWRITSLGGTADKDPISILFPAVTSVAAPVLALVFWRRAVGIAEHGVAVTATVLSIGNSIQSMRNVEFEYTHDGIVYRKKKSVDDYTSEELEPGGPLEIIVDKRNVKRILIK
jgi:hypothetical protein